MCNKVPLCLWHLQHLGGESGKILHLSDVVWRFTHACAVGGADLLPFEEYIHTLPGFYKAGALSKHPGICLVKRLKGLKGHKICNFIHLVGGPSWCQWPTSTTPLTLRLAFPLYIHSPNSNPHACKRRNCSSETHRTKKIMVIHW